MKLGSLFAGIGGFELATKAGIVPIWSNEIDPFCCKVVLRKNFNHEIIEGDIKECGKLMNYLKQY